MIPYEYERIMDILNEAEQRFPVDRWQIEHMHVWPVIRQTLAGSFFEKQFQKKSQGSLRIRVPFLTFSKTCFAWARASWCDRSQNVLHPCAKADVFFWTSSRARRALPDGRKYSLSYDPLIRLIQKRGLSSLMWEWAPGNEYHIPRYSPSFFIQPWLTFQLWRWRKQKADALEVEPLEHYADFLDFVRQYGNPTQNLEINTLISKVRRIRFFADQAKKWLKKIKPICVFTTYQGDYERVLHLACHEMGILSVKIQHGVQGDYQLDYGRWSRVPGAGFELLPKCFWSWDTPSAEAINRWAKQCPGVHQAVVGGNVWYQEWEHIKDRGAKRQAVEEQIQTIKENASGKTHVLVSLQPPEKIYASGELIPDFVLEAMRVSSGKFFWWVRLHPSMSRRQRVEILHHLRAQNLKNIELEYSTDVLLPVLLGHMDVHATAHSTVITDAEALGIASVSWLEVSKKYFPEQYRTGRLTLAYDAQGLLSALETQRHNKSLPAENEPLSAERAMDQILAQADLLKKQFEQNKT